MSLRTREQKDAELSFSRLLAFSIMLIRSAAAQRDDFLGGLPMRAGMALEKPAVWAEPPARARKDALLQAKRLYYRLRIEYLEGSHHRSCTDKLA